VRLGTGKLAGALALASISLTLAPAWAGAKPALSLSVAGAPENGARAAASVNVLTINDLRRIDNRITAYTAPTGRLVLTAPEGLSDPDGSGDKCSLDNAPPGQSSAQQVSCAPDFIQVIVGDLGAGNDTFSADPALLVLLGSVVDGVRRPLAGGDGDDRLVGGAGGDLFDGGLGADSLVGGGGQDLLAGGASGDNLSGGADRDVLYGGAGPDKLSGGASRDLCSGGGARDTGKTCEVVKSVP
jgi:hypothetical protein